MIECPENDGLCKRDKVGYQAIYELFTYMDMNNDRTLKVAESDGFVRDYMNRPADFVRHLRYHNEHGQGGEVSLAQMWRAWTSGPG